MVLFEQVFEQVGNTAFPPGAPDSTPGAPGGTTADATEEVRGMTRRYDDPVEVRRRDEDPAEFLWRGRFYAVREVLAHWVETGAWWQPSAGSAVDGSAALSLDSPALAAEREVWRVEASPGRLHGSGVYDLCFDWAAGGWTLLRTQD